MGHLQVRVFLFTLFFFLPPATIIIFLDDDNSEYKLSTWPYEETAIIPFFFLYTIIYDLLDFIDFLFTPTKTNKQNIIIKRRWRLLWFLFFLPLYILTHSHHQYDAASASTFVFLIHQQYNFLRKKLCRAGPNYHAEHLHKCKIVQNRKSVKICIFWPKKTFILVLVGIKLCINAQVLQ